MSNESAVPPSRKPIKLADLTYQGIRDMLREQLPKLKVCLAVGGVVTVLIDLPCSKIILVEVFQDRGMWATTRLEDDDTWRQVRTLQQVLLEVRKAAKHVRDLLVEEAPDKTTRASGPTEGQS
jgi:hypothetical protein